MHLLTLANKDISKHTFRDQQQKIYERHSIFQKQLYSKVIKIFLLRSKGWHKWQQQQQKEGKNKNYSDNSLKKEEKKNMV